MVQAGSSDTGRRFAARNADAVFTAHMAKDTAQEFYADLKRLAAVEGRAPEHVLILPPPDVVIPPRASAVLSADTTDRQSQREHIRMIAVKGRMGWQRAIGYGRRNLVETAIGRYKHLIGSTLRARSLATQQGEVAMAVRALNRMINGAKPLSVRVT